MQSDRQMLSLSEAAEYYGVSTRTIRRQIAAGNLPAIRVGTKVVRVNRADLDALAHPIPAGAA